MRSGWKYKIGQKLYDDKRDLTIIEQLYIDKIKKYKYLCDKCGFNEGIISQSNLSKGYGCSCCAGRTVVVGINDIPTTAPWMIPYFQGGYNEAGKYTYNSNKKITPLCPDCNTIKSKPTSINRIYRTRSIGCGCGDGKSYPEKFVLSVLKQLRLKYEQEFSPDWLEGKRFDFCVNHIIIEVDGGLGHGNKIHSHSKLSKEQTIEVDKWKEEQAKIHGYKVFRINAEKSEINYLKTNIIETLSKVFDLSKINWSLCDQAGLKNIVKDVAEYYMKHKPISTIEIGKDFELSYDTIRNYLKKAAQYYWCDYSSKKGSEERYKKLSKDMVKRRSKRVSVYKDSIFIKQYQSVMECDENSLNDFGVKLNYKNISQVCLGQKKHHKGFTFKYTVEIEGELDGS